MQQTICFGEGEHKVANKTFEKLFLIINFNFVATEMAYFQQ